MREEIRIELRRAWYHNGKEVAGYRSKQSWTSGWSETVVDSSITSTNEIDLRQLRKFCNKPTALYWAHSAQVDDRFPRLIFGCLFRQCFRCYNHKPRLDFERFFATPVRITLTSPTTVSGIPEAHEHLCNQASSPLEKFRRDEDGRPYMSAWADPHKCKLLPLCRAIMIVLNELAPDIVLDPGGFISLDDELQRQSDLMVRTGDESGLSEPINLENVRG